MNIRSTKPRIIIPVQEEAKVVVEEKVEEKKTVDVKKEGAKVPENK